MHDKRRRQQTGALKAYQNAAHAALSARAARPAVKTAQKSGAAWAATLD